MTGYVIGSLCSGYEGLGTGAAAALGGTPRLAWVSDNDPGASAILAHRFPGVPNLGDLRAADWGGIEVPDVLCAGFPCQGASSAGKRKGVEDERWLWPDIAAGLGRMGTLPRLLVLENVPGLLTVSNGHAMAQVIYSLARLGYVGRYGLYSASGWAGAPHRRRRWFCLAWHASRWDATDPARLGSGASAADSEYGPEPERARSPRREEGERASAGIGPESRGDVSAADAGRPGLQGPDGTQGHSDGQRQAPDDGRGGLDARSHAAADAAGARRGRGEDPGADRGAACEGDGDAREAARRGQPERDGAGAGDGHLALLKTPTAQLGSNGGSQHPGKRRAGGHGPTLDDQVSWELLPTPAAGNFSDGESLESWEARRQRNLAKGINGNGQGTPLAVEWGRYEPAIRRWEGILGRPAPCPAEPGKNGNRRLSAEFAEWLMGLPSGWVTGVPGLARTAQLRAIGNGVVPQQAAAAVRHLLRPAVRDA